MVSWFGAVSQTGLGHAVVASTPNCNNVVIEKIKQKAKKPNRNKLAM